MIISIGSATIFFFFYSPCWYDMIRTVNFSCLINFRVISVFFCDQDSFFILLLYMYANHVEIKSYETFFVTKYLLNIQSQTDTYYIFMIFFVACTTKYITWKMGEKVWQEYFKYSIFTMVMRSLAFDARTELKRRDSLHFEFL